MLADKTLFDALSEIGIPVNRVAAKYANTDVIPGQYFVYAITGGSPSYSDDYLEYIELYYTVMLFSKTDYTSVLRQTVDVLNVDGVRISSLGAEMYDPDIDFYQIPINVAIQEFWEED